MSIDAIGFDLDGDDPSEDGDDTDLNPELLHFLLEQDQGKNSRREPVSLKSYRGEYLPSSERLIPYTPPLEF